MLNYLGLIPLIPFGGFLLNGLFGKKAGKGFVTFVALAASLLAAIGATIAVVGYAGAYPQGKPHIDFVYHWFSSGGIGTDIAFPLDPLSVVMVRIVTWVGFRIRVSSVGSLAQEEG